MARRKSGLAWAKWLSLPIGMALLLLVLLLLVPSAPETPEAPVTAAERLPVERTLAHRMLRREQAVRQVPSSVEPLLRKVLSEAMAALGPDPAPPSTAAEFKAFAEKVSIVLAANNFVQPGSVDDWPDTLGEAFAPLPRGRPAGHLRAEGGSAGEAEPRETGWTHLLRRLRHGRDADHQRRPDGRVRRGDGRGAGPQLSCAGSRPKGRPRAGTGPIGERRTRGARPRACSARSSPANVFLASQTLKESEAYFKSALASRVDDQPARLALRREAAADFPNNRVVAYGVAHTFALSPGASPAERREALGYSLLALSMEGNGNAESVAHRMMAVACAYAANREPALAKAFVHRARTVAGIDEEYGGSIAAIRAHRTCHP
jgi:hypothetical protein